ncbi:MAG: hypothetical protein LBL91_00270 [Lachnospiraceae bacterium]|jgi:hypothetical protein|nr:hypothetical protein [Lachnospiraceae bacterium]
MELISYLLIMFSIMFWVFRTIVALTANMNIDIGFMPPNVTTEIIVLFVTLLCLVLIVRRRVIGAIAYLGLYGWYFGTIIYNLVSPLEEGMTLSPASSANFFVSILGIILAVCVFVDVTVGNTRKGTTSHKKTDWFYKNENLDRQLDERADKNNYRIM